MPVDVPGGLRGGAAIAATTFAVDETPRRDTTAERLAALEPAFLPEGRVTAGSSSQICDGTAAVLIASESAVSRLGPSRGHASSRSGSGVDPHRMLHGNPEACANALARADLTWDDIAVVEVNEAFASVPIQFMRDTGLTERWADVNPNGGGISLDTARCDRRTRHGDAAERAGPP